MRFSIPKPIIGSKADRVFGSSLLLFDWLSLIAFIAWGWFYAFTQDPTLTTVLDKIIVGVLLTVVILIIHSIVLAIVWGVIGRLYALIRALWMVAYERWLA